MEKLVVDSNLKNDFFEAKGTTTMVYPRKMVIVNENTGKTDSFLYEPHKDTNVILNADISDKGRRHYGFNICESYFEGDTLVIQLENIYSFFPNSMLNDKIFIYIIGRKFYIKYKYVISLYWLVVKSQKLTVKKLVTQKGERLMGELTVQFINQNPKAKTRIFEFTGPFDCIVR